jgi:hypothetical protein
VPRFEEGEDEYAPAYGGEMVIFRFFSRRQLEQMLLHVVVAASHERRASFFRFEGFLPVVLSMRLGAQSEAESDAAETLDWH